MSKEQLFLEGAEEQMLLQGAANEEEAEGAMSQATEATTQSKSKRGANKVPTKSWVVTKLSKENFLEEPVEAAEKFSNTCNAIVRVRARIYQRWSDVPEAVKQDCYEAAWKRFVPANDEIKRRLEWRMHQVMRKGQSTWQYNYRKLIGKDWKTEEIREKRPFDHRLGSRGRLGKEKVWAKEDAALDQAGIQPRVPTLLRGERSSKWMRSSMTANQWAGLELMSEKQEAALGAMAEWESDGSHSSINQQWDDAISYALQRNEHGGHMRGVGSGPFRRQMAKEHGSRKHRRASSKEQSSEDLDEKIRVLVKEELRKLMRLARDQRDVDNFIDHGVFPEAPIQPTPPASDPSLRGNKSTSCSGTECQLDPLGPPDQNLTKGIKCRLHMPTVGNPLGAHGLLMPRTAVVHHVTLRDDIVRVQVDSVLRGFEDEPVPYPPHKEAMTLRDCVNSYLIWPRRLVVSISPASVRLHPPDA
ncbi:hypothetical protein BRADI_1g05202v3 [Brachypodium distachyon]|uniref:DUF8039 domain-containing protein n=1 Tax=Brachypodium distachyon TaxID=15368 RepID=A0A0Q3GQH4_BRADI|nr:hypothetical protein BRADI_1g05202v3 [Brachypodium distachyon]